MSKYKVGDEIRISDGSNDKGVILKIDFSQQRFSYFYLVERAYENGSKLKHWYGEDEIVL